MEIKFSKDVLFQLVDKLRELREIEQVRAIQPDLGLFVLKQAFISGVPIQTQMIWPDQH